MVGAPRCPLANPTSSHVAQGSGDNKGLSEKMDSDEKEQILDALKDGSLV